MVKYAKGEDKPFDPISNKVLSAIAAPIEATVDADAPPALLQDEEVPEARPEPKPESKPAPSRSSSERGRGLKEKRPVPKRRVPVTAKSERLSRVVKCLFTPTEEQELRALVGRLATEAKFSLTLSHLIRPYCELLAHCEEQLTSEIRRAELTRPINEKTAIALFEALMAEAIHSALKKSPQFRTERRDGEA